MSRVSCNRISDDIRYDGKNHLIIPTQEKKEKDVQVKDVRRVFVQCVKSVTWASALNVLKYFIL